jgi:hypothetical protein
MEPIQDDIELLREAVATGGFDYAVRGVYQEALDRLVAERDRLRRIELAAQTFVLHGTDLTYDELMAALEA